LICSQLSSIYILKFIKYNSIKVTTSPSTDYSTVTDLSFSTPNEKLILFLTYKYKFKLNKEGHITENDYFDFDISLINKN